MYAGNILQISLAGAIGMNNRGAMGATPVPAGAPPAAGPGAMMPDGAMGMVMYLQHYFSGYSLLNPFKEYSVGLAMETQLVVSLLLRLRLALHQRPAFWPPLCSHICGQHGTCCPNLR